MLRSTQLQKTNFPRTTQVIVYVFWLLRGGEGGIRTLALGLRMSADIRGYFIIRRLSVSADFTLNPHVSNVSCRGIFLCMLSCTFGKLSTYRELPIVLKLSYRTYQVNIFLLSLMVTKNSVVLGASGIKFASHWKNKKDIFLHLQRFLWPWAHPHLSIFLLFAVDVKASIFLAHISPPPS